MYKEAKAKQNQIKLTFLIDWILLTGTITEKNYDHFSGTMQVMKAVGNHLVLTFCYQEPDKKLYSMLFSRQLFLSDTEINGVHNLLKRRHLHIGNVRKVCNGSSNIKNNLFLSVLLAVLLCLRKLLWFKC